MLINISKSKNRRAALQSITEPTRGRQPRQTAVPALFQRENNLVSIAEQDIDPAQDLRDPVRRLYFVSERWPDPIGGVRGATSRVDQTAFSSALN
jgi:hypothetical protein